MDRIYYYDASLDDGAIYDVTVADSEPVDTTMESQVRVFHGDGSYHDLADKPSIEGVTLEGDRSFRDLGLEEITAQDIDEIIFGGG